MPHEKVTELIDQLIRATEEGKIPWVATAKADEFTASFIGKFGVIVAMVPPDAYEKLAGYPDKFELRVMDELGRIVLDVEGASVRPLLESARRTALHTDKAIDDILHELKTR